MKIKLFARYQPTSEFFCVYFQGCVTCRQAAESITETGFSCRDLNPSLFSYSVAPPSSSQLTLHHVGLDARSRGARKSYAGQLPSRPRAHGASTGPTEVGSHMPASLRGQSRGTDGDRASHSRSARHAHNPPKGTDTHWPRSGLPRGQGSSEGCSHGCAICQHSLPWTLRTQRFLHACGFLSCSMGRGGRATAKPPALTTT